MDSVTDAITLCPGRRTQAADRAMELIMAFEEEFSTDDKPVEISDEEAGNIATIKDAVKYLKEQGVEDG